MKNYLRRVIFLVLLAMGVVAVVWALRTGAAPKTRPNAQISVVLYGDTTDRWRSLSQGIAQGCTELELEKPVITAVPASGGAAEQLKTLRREVEHGADGLLVAAVCDGDMREGLAELAKEVPVVLLESGVEGMDAVSADDAQMGRELAARLAKAGGKAVVLRPYPLRGSVKKRITAFMDEAAVLGVPAEVWDFDSRVASSTITSRLAQGAPDALVAPDNETLEAAVEALAGGEAAAKLYGMGQSDKAVSSLDHGAVEEICFQNEYSIGYTGLMRLAAAMGFDVPDYNKPIEFRLIRRENMYDAENERLLFPIIE